MSHPTRQFVLVILFASALSLALFLVAQRMMEPKILTVHTEFLFWQLEDNYSTRLAAKYPPATSEREFLDLVPGWIIDWNSCDFRDGVIYDGWDTAVEVRVSPDLIEFRSAGPDRQIGTQDDLLRKISGGPTTQSS